MSGERASGRVLGLIPWIFALTIVLAVVIGVRNQAPTFPDLTQEDRVLEVLRAREADLRERIEKNLTQAGEILNRIAEEMEKEHYDAQLLIAAIREKTRELSALKDELQRITVQIQFISVRRGF
jgi:hypothetical protein